MRGLHPLSKGAAVLALTIYLAPIYPSTGLLSLPAQVAAAVTAVAGPLSPLQLVLLMLAVVAIDVLLMMTERPWKPAPLLSPADIAAAGLGPPDLSTKATGSATLNGVAIVPARGNGVLSPSGRLYVDMVRRTVSNIPYYEVSTPLMTWRAVSHEFEGVPAFDLATRVEGEDSALNCLSMCGWRRTGSVASCVEVRAWGRRGQDILHIVASFNARWREGSRAHFSPCSFTFIVPF